jgi:Flp pilus assembly CpaF family ATPase
MNKQNRLDELCDEMAIKEKKQYRLSLGCGRLQATIDALDLVDGTINEKDRIYKTRGMLYSMYDDALADRTKVERQLDELAVEFDRLVDEYFEETGNYYYPEREEWPAWSSFVPSWMKASK